MVDLRNNYDNLRKVNSHLYVLKSLRICLVTGV